jgi:dipeptidyl aminopeptidase/acylaminoacyl peptidase
MAYMLIFLLLIIDAHPPVNMPPDGCFVLVQEIGEAKLYESINGVFLERSTLNTASPVFQWSETSQDLYYVDFSESETLLMRYTAGRSDIVESWMGFLDLTLSPQLDYVTYQEADKLKIVSIQDEGESAIDVAEGIIEAITWSSDGQRLALIVKQPMDRYEVWIIDVAAGQIIQKNTIPQVTSRLSNQQSWSLDSRWFAWDSPTAQHQPTELSLALPVYSPQMGVLDAETGDVLFIEGVSLVGWTEINHLLMVEDGAVMRASSPMFVNAELFFQLDENASQSGLSISPQGKYLIYRSQGSNNSVSEVLYGQTLIVVNLENGETMNVDISSSVQSSVRWSPACL